MSVLALLTAVLLTQAAVPAPSVAIRPGAAVPDALVVPGVRVHVYASEDLDPDALGMLARPGVVLWLSTRSNTLRASTLQRLGRFEQSWVEVRAPLRPSELGAVSRLPKCGLWIRDGKTLTPALARLGIGRLAVQLDGPISTERFEDLEQLSPSQISWSSSTVDLASFGRFVQSPGARVLRVPKEALQCDRGAPASRRVHETALAVSLSEVDRAIACGFIPRVTLDPGVDDDSLKRLFARAPNAELEIHVGTDERRALAARKLIDRLEGGRR